MNPQPYLEEKLEALDVKQPVAIKTGGKKKKKKEANRALQTYFKNSYRTHISLSALADRKSNIMVRLNSLLIGLLIVFFESIVSYTKATIVTGVIFLISTLISLIFAALAARPHITKNIDSSTSKHEVKKDLFFFGNFVELELNEYEQIMDSILKKTDLIYENMLRDLYYLGVVLDKKFRLLSYSYNIFIWGLIATVISFLATLLI